MGLCVFCSSVFFCEKKNIVGVCVDSFFSHRAHRANRAFWRTVSSPQDSGPSPNPSPAGRGVICEVTPIGLLVWGVERFFFHAGDFFLSQSARSSRRFLAHGFESTERLRHTEFTERYC